MILPGTYNFTDRAYSDFSNVSIRALIPGSVTIKTQWAPSSSAGYFGAFTFYSDTVTPIRNIRIKDIIFDHNGYKTAAVILRGNTSASVMSENIRLDGCEFLNRAGDASGALASVLAITDYSGSVGLMRNFKIKDCTFHDNTANVGTYPYSVLILSNSLENFKMEGCIYRDLYGTTVATVANTIRTRKDWSFSGNRFTNTKLGTLSVGTTMDIYDNNRLGFHGIRITDNYFEDNQSFAFSEDKFHLGIYNSNGFIVNHNDFYYSRAIIAPGHSSPAGNESIGWTFSDNLLMDINEFSDFDGHYAGSYDNNIFVRMKYGQALGGYGNHFPSNYTNNLCYNCCLNPSTSQEWTQSIFLIEDGGNIFANNTIYDDTPSTKLKYVFCELRGGGGSGNGTANPNIYENNHVLGTGPSAQTFYLDAAFKHIIKGNTGITEAVIQNSQTNGVAGTSALIATDVIVDNFKSNGSPVSNPNPATFGRLLTKTAAYTLTATDSTILADATSAAFTVTLPTPVGISGRQYTIKKIDSSVNVVTIASTAGTIDGAVTKALSAQWQAVRLVSDGVNWFVV